jgi:cold shock CspA family protein
MEREGKLFGIVSMFDEPRGFGFIVQRQPSGQRKSWFFHVSHLEGIEGVGAPQKGAKCWFDEDLSNPKGPMAVNVQVGAVVPKFEKVVFDALAGKVGIGGAE